MRWIQSGGKKTVAGGEFRAITDQEKYVGQIFSYTALSLSEKTQKITFSSWIDRGRARGQSAVSLAD